VCGGGAVGGGGVGGGGGGGEEDSNTINSGTSYRLSRYALQFFTFTACSGMSQHQQFSCSIKLSLSQYNVGNKKKICSAVFQTQQHLLVLPCPVNFKSMVGEFRLQH